MAYIVSLLAIRFLMGYVKRHDFKVFGWYRIVLGALVLGYWAVSYTHLDFARRAWNFVAVGSGHNEQWWSEFLSVVRMSGYNDVVSLEMEDLTMSMMEGHLYSLDILKRAMVLNH